MESLAVIEAALAAGAVLRVKDACAGREALW
jgi:hypothetical protein